MNLKQILTKQDVIAHELKAIYEKEKLLTAENVLNHAKDENNPLHDLFTWDDSKAAHEYRLWEARSLIKSVKVTIKTGVEEVTVRKYVNLRTDETNNANPWGHNSEYKEVKEVLNDEQRREIMYQQALNELNSFRKKYHNFQIFENIIKEIDKILAA